MHCLVVLLALVAPRIALAGIWLLTDWFARAYETTLWPLLGFLFMPYTTLATMAAMLHNHGTVSGWWVALLIVAVVADLSSDSSAGHKSARRKREAPAR